MMQPISIVRIDVFWTSKIPKRLNDFKLADQTVRLKASTIYMHIFQTRIRKQIHSKKHIFTPIRYILQINHKNTFTAILLSYSFIKQNKWYNKPQQSNQNPNLHFALCFCIFCAFFVVLSSIIYLGSIRVCKKRNIELWPKNNAVKFFLYLHLKRWKCVFGKNKKHFYDISYKGINLTKVTKYIKNRKLEYRID